MLNITTTSDRKAIMEAWLSYLEAEGRSPNTVIGYQRGLEHFLSWYVKTYGDETFNPAAVLPKDFKDWISFQQTVERAKPATINQRVAAIRQYFTYLFDTGQISRNPSKGVKSLDRDDDDFKGLDEQEYRRLMRAVYADENLRDIAIVEVMGGAGLRVGEVLDLQVGDLVIRERETEKNYSYIIVREGKGMKRRSIPMAKSVKDALNAYLAKHPNKEVIGAPLWIGQRGALSDRSAISRLLAYYARKAGLDEKLVHAHALRHTFAHRYLEKFPGDIRTLADLLGHKDLKTTMKYTVSSGASKARKMAEME
jgi:site-specific recombinase XerC